MVRPVRARTAALSPLALAVALAPLVAASPAQAQQDVTRPDVVRPLPTILPYRPPPSDAPPRPDVLVAANLGTVDRGTTGTLVGFGYDGTASMIAGLDVRVLGPVGCGRCFTHGVAVGYNYSAGPTFGVFHDAAFRMHLVDLAYVGRFEFPCMRRGNRRVHMSGLLGAVGGYADAGLGDTTRDNDERLNERTMAATRYDHASIGWRLGVSLDFTLDRAIVGVGVDLRELYAVGDMSSRTFMLGAGLRVGFDLALPGSPAARARANQYE